jgi:anti-sigma-K factor RskA
MRSELNEIFLTEQWLLSQLSEDEARNVEARLLLDEAFAEKVEAQRICHRLIRHYARAQDRSRLEKIYRLLLNETGFAHQLNTIFI